jgi:hypothetical protein
VKFVVSESQIQVEHVSTSDTTTEFSDVFFIMVGGSPLPAPILLTPADGTVTHDSTPTFEWMVVADADKYRIQVDDNEAFSSPQINVQRTSPIYSFPMGLPDGTWYWRVQAGGSDGSWGIWSEGWGLAIDTVGPDQPSLTEPLDGATIHSNQPTLRWNAVSEAVSYHIQIDINTLFLSPVLVESYINSVQFVPGEAMLDGRWYWRACD